MKKKNLIIIGIVALFVILVIGVLVFVNRKPHESIFRNPGEPEEIPTLRGLEEYTYSCDKRLEDDLTVDYTTIVYEHLKVEDGMVLSSQSTIKRYYYDQAGYEQGKKEDLGENVLYLDDELSIEYPDGEMIDYTKTIDGKPAELSYYEYKISHEDLGYACTRIEE